MDREGVGSEGVADGGPSVTLTRGLSGTDRSGVPTTVGSAVPAGPAVSEHPARAAASTTATTHRPTIPGP
ncbi:hypothetical protein [Kribbella sp. CA-293567]|uniref:hypothetical protein n=1 Tax=Kribbella sp. CA-293567 TaxID=3002436 RepID=UPI0022DE365F|nr:hypothetical protein [Kribbella sp. CA-293567]WBQ04309.1 hypothetical protein OX958_30620 [Kribbella sp. CA-293567]